MTSTMYMMTAPADVASYVRDTIGGAGKTRITAAYGGEVRLAFDSEALRLLESLKEDQDGCMSGGFVWIMGDPYEVAISS